MGSDGNVRFDGKMPPLFGVFDAAPVTPSPPSAGNASENLAVKRQAKGNMMVWLEEYLRWVLFVWGGGGARRRNGGPGSCSLVN